MRGLSGQGSPQALIDSFCLLSCDWTDLLMPAKWWREGPHSTHSSSSLSCHEMGLCPVSTWEKYKHALSRFVCTFLSLTLLWFDLSKSFKICLLAKWLSIFLNLLKHSIIFCYWKDLKGTCRQIGLWYIPMIKVCLFRELFHLSKPFIGPFCQTVF